jgi:hypothetical protein
VPVADHPVGSAAEQGQNFDLQHVTGPCVVQCHGSGDDVRAVCLRQVFACGGGQFDGVVQQAVRGDTGRPEEGGRVAALVFEDALVADGVEGDGLARADGQRRFGGGVGQQAPVHPGRVGGQVVVTVQGAESGLEELHFRASRRAPAVRVNPKHWRTL